MTLLNDAPGTRLNVTSLTPQRAAPGLSGPPKVTKTSQLKAMSSQRRGLNSQKSLFTWLHTVIKFQTAIAKCLWNKGTQEHANSWVRLSDKKSRRESCHVQVGITLIVSYLVEVKQCWYEEGSSGLISWSSHYLCTFQVTKRVFFLARQSDLNGSYWFPFVQPNLCRTLGLNKAPYVKALVNPAYSMSTNTVTNRKPVLKKLKKCQC